jgi:hypothetical protein
MNPFWRGAEGYLQERPLANERNKGSRRHLLPGEGGKTSHRVGAFEAAVGPGQHPGNRQIGRHVIVPERLKCLWE